MKLGTRKQQLGVFSEIYGIRGVTVFLGRNVAY